MSKKLCALRGATTVDEDTPDQVRSRTIALLKEMMDRNSIELDDIVSVIFTVTSDVHSMFPATAARDIGFSGIPLICAREIDVEGALPLCLRVLMHFETDIPRSQLRPIYAEGAIVLREDLQT